MNIRPLTILGACLAVLAALGALATASAQEQAPTFISISQELRQAGIKFSGGYVDVYANNAFCGRLSFTDARVQTPDGGARLELAKAEQPAACRTEGATITLVDGRGFPIVDSTPPVTYPATPKKYALKLGSTIEIEDLSIPPVSTGDEQPTPAAPAAGTGFVASPTSRPFGAALAASGAALALAGIALCFAGRVRRATV